MMLYKVKEYLEKLKEDKKLDYEWAKSYAGSLFVKNSSKDLDEIIQLLRRDMINDTIDKLFFNRFNPTEFGKTKFIVFHKENIKSTPDYANFEKKFKNEINDDELTTKAENWLAQIPFFDWKIYALKLLSNIIYLNETKIDKKLEEITKYISSLNNFVISNIEGIEKSSVHLFYPLNKLIEKPSVKFISSQNLSPVDNRSIVFIDDMIGTGHQAINYINKLKNEGKIGNRKLYYYAIVGLKEGINELKKSGIFQDVLVTEVVSNTAFDTGYIFTSEESGNARDMAYSLGEQITKGLKKIDPLGYGNSGALVFFRYNSPNNSLPIFWASGKCKILEPLGEQTEVNWTSLFPRKEKPKTSESESTSNEPIFNVPLKNRFFTGREKYIEQLHEALKLNGAMALSQPQAISGLGGIGKTQTAVEYAYKYKDEYKAVFWAYADSKESIISGFVKIASLLNLPVKDDKEQELIAASVKHWLETNNGWLLIFDNADDPKLVEKFFPFQTKGHIILTSRAQIFANLRIMDPLKMDEMSPDESKQFLLIRTGRNAIPLNQIETDAIEQLGKELGYFPLALEQAGAYIHEKISSFNDYLISYRKRGLELLEETKSDRYPESIATTWSLNFEQVKQTSNAAIDLLYVSAFLSPYSIPLELIAHGAKELGAALSASLADVESDPVTLNKVLEPLSKYSLISIDPVSHTYSIHRMVQAVLKDKMDSDTRRQWGERTIKSVDKAFPKVEFKAWDVCERMIPHAKFCLELIEKSNFEFQEAARLLNKAGKYLKERALFGEAKQFLEQALDIRKKVLVKDHPDLAETYNDFAGLYIAQGKYKEAEVFYNNALDIRKKVLDKDDPDLAETFNDFAGLYHAQGKYKEAEVFYNNALDIRKKILGENHPDLAETFNDFGRLYSVQGRYKEAEEYYNNALNIEKKVLGGDHPDLATTLNNLGSLYHDQGKYKESEEYYNTALNIEKKVLGEDHPHLAATLNNLGSLYHDQGKHKESEEYYNTALNIKKKVLGEDHPDLGAAFNNLGSLYHDQGKYKEAEEYYNTALNIKKKVLGEDHPDLAKTLYNLGSLYHDQGKYKEAEEYYNTALNIKKKVLGEDHPDLAKTLHNLGLLYQDQAKYSKAKPLFKKAIEIMEKSFGKESPLIVPYLTNYADFLQKTHKNREATIMKIRVKAIQDKQKSKKGKD